MGKAHSSKFFYAFMIVVLGGFVSVFFQNCGDVNLGQMNQAEVLRCSEFDFSRPETIYADASTDPEKIIFRVYERDKANVLTTSSRRFRWTVDSRVQNNGEPTTDISVRTSSLIACDPFQVTATLEACGQSIGWRLSYQLPSTSSPCPEIQTTTTIASTTTTVGPPPTTIPGIPPQEQPYTGAPPSSCLTGGSGVCSTPTGGPGGTTVMSGGNLGLVLALAGQSSQYGYAFISSEQTFVIPYRTRSTDNGTNFNIPVKSLKIYNPGIYQACMCKFSISKTPGDFRPILAGPNYPQGGSHRCMGFTGTDAGVGIPIVLFPTSATAIPNGDFCPLKPDSDYFLNVTCGGPTNGPPPLLQALESYPWNAHFGCDKTDPLYTSDINYYFACQRCAISSAEQ